MWRKCLEERNRKLKSLNKPEFSCYHAVDCNHRRKEFKEWSVDEQVEFVKELIYILGLYFLVIYSCSLDLRDLVDVFPEARDKSKELAFAILLRQMMPYLSDKILGDERWPNDELALIHEECEYDGVLSNSFKSIKNDETLQHRNRFTTIKAMGWKDCVLLQAADLITYEGFKAHRELDGAPRRKSLEAIVGLDSVGGKGYKLLKLGLEQIRDGLSDETRRALFRDARISNS
jgi:hypothetical protein